MSCVKTVLSDWIFSPSPDRAQLSEGQHVRVPHTWNVQDETQSLQGACWYRYTLELKQGTLPEDARLFLHFGAAFLHAMVYVNDTLVMDHPSSGYTPFRAEITEAVHIGTNVIDVSVDNSFSEDALPCLKSYDWPNDGGLIRPVTLEITSACRLLDLQAVAEPVLPSGVLNTFFDPDHALCQLSFSVRVDTPRSDSLKGHELCWFLRDGDTQAPDRVAALPVVASGSVSASALDSAMCLHAYDTIQNLQLWHFDRPKLYTLDLQLRNPKGETVDQICSAIGFRTLRRIGTRLYLNGEPVRLPGMEWMPGSSPDSGMAESPEEMYSMLQLLKDAGCTLTRFHWQQSEEVLSWCDRHGLLAQEEIPFWGKVPADDQLKMWPVAQQQLRDTICAHFNHPSIISWGVGNELAGASEQAQLYVRRAVALCRELDPSRLACYVSDTALRSPMHDGTESGDVMMVNDYIGTWHGNLDSEATWQTFCASHPDAVFIPSEFGLCEPAFDGGDERRGRIFLEKLQQYRRIPQVAGTIYFCLNDYRTHMGEDGDGKFRQRIHGSCGLRGEKKPSYAIVQREYLPLTISRDGQKVILRCRDDLPSYTLRGYVLRGGKDDSYTVALPTLHPGETFETTTFKLGKSVEIVRADGSLVLRCNIADL